MLLLLLVTTTGAWIALLVLLNRAFDKLMELLAEAVAYVLFLPLFEFDLQRAPCYVLVYRIIGCDLPHLRDFNALRSRCRVIRVAQLVWASDLF